jgi:hypothetical protein
LSPGGWTKQDVPSSELEALLQLLKRDAEGDLEVNLGFSGGGLNRFQKRTAKVLYGKALVRLATKTA